MKIGYVLGNGVHKLQTTVELCGHGDMGMAESQHFSENIRRLPERV